ncbi:hypothetical protein ACWDTB_37025, partial [Streptomyces sp. NPDC003487]
PPPTPFTYTIYKTLSPSPPHYRTASATRPAPRGGSGRPAPRTTGTRLRPANPRLLRQRLTVFFVVTLLVALGIALVQGCEGPARGLGGDGGVRPTHESVRPQVTPLDEAGLMAQRYESASSRD